ncbi:hypothetical protein LTR16_010361, partial [Cryomyces antarcticus]
KLDGSGAPLRRGRRFSKFLAIAIFYLCRGGCLLLRRTENLGHLRPDHLVSCLQRSARERQSYPCRSPEPRGPRQFRRFKRLLLQPRGRQQKRQRFESQRVVSVLPSAARRDRLRLHRQRSRQRLIQTRHLVSVLQTGAGWLRTAPGRRREARSIGASGITTFGHVLAEKKVLRRQRRHAIGQQESPLLAQVKLRQAR